MDAQDLKLDVLIAQDKKMIVQDMNIDALASMLEQVLARLPAATVY